jgi:prepilin-type processing-associated H-X9-DG protein
MEERSPGRRAFTLVEMLVVMGIIILLASLLFPLLTNARRAAANTKCLNNLRQIGMAISQYTQAHDDTLPSATASNIWDDPISPNGAKQRGLTAAIQPIGEVLDPYLKHDLKIWRCPGAPVFTSEPSGLFREPCVTEKGLRRGVNPTPPGWQETDSLWRENGQWRPGYMYVSTVGWVWYRDHMPPDYWNPYLMESWVVRNVAGLKATQLRTVSMQPAPEIVIFLDYNSLFHGKEPISVYAKGGPTAGFDSNDYSNVGRGRFESNLLYLDGHVESKQYGWSGGLVNLLHKPIPQHELGKKEFAELFEKGFAKQYPN